MTRMQTVTEIIIHCSSTFTRMDIGVAEIRDWHVGENGWEDVGYHYVIRRDGTVEPGRDLRCAGAHCVGHNSNSIGICLVGGLLDSGKPGDNFTQAQFDALADLLGHMKHVYPKARICGHCEFADKACPAFDYRKFLRERGLQS